MRATACITRSAWPAWRSPTRCWASCTPWRIRPARLHSGGHIVHGCANAMYLPKVIKFNAKEPEADKRYCEIAAFLGLEHHDGRPDRAHQEDERRARTFLPASAITKAASSTRRNSSKNCPRSRRTPSATPAPAPTRVRSRPKQMEQLLTCCFYDTEVDF